MTDHVSYSPGIVEKKKHFLLRPHFTRRTSCRCGCGRYSALYPEGFRAGAVATDHLLNSNQWTLLALIGLVTATRTPRCPPPHLLCGALVKVPLFTALTTSIRSWIDLPCVLCGHGDNSVQHWMRFCPVPALALLNRPWRTHDWSLRPTFSASRLAMIGALWVGTRQFVHERSGLPPPSLASPLFYAG